MRRQAGQGGGGCVVVTCAGGGCGETVLWGSQEGMAVSAFED